RFYRFTHLGLSEGDAIVAAGLGQVHLALFDAASKEREAALRNQLAERAPGAAIIALPGRAMLLVASEALTERARQEVLDAVEAID
ncbi:MAG: hypothetical protein D6760_12695, partial [Deltaproteobacteria bacterium]